MLDRARPELIRSDLLRSSALDPSLESRRVLGRTPTKRTPRLTFNWKMPLAAFLLVEFLVAITPEMADQPTPLAVDIAGYVFVYGMLGLMLSIIVPTRWTAPAGVGVGSLGLGLHAMCGLGGHVPMTAGWFIGSAALMAGFVAVSGVLTAKTRL